VPVIARIQDERVWLDFRTVLPGEFADLADALNALCLQK
jgi:seryl-tRNA(Sec) selenium transferase